MTQENTKDQYIKNKKGKIYTKYGENRKHK